MEPDRQFCHIKLPETFTKQPHLYMKVQMSRPALMSNINYCGLLKMLVRSAHYIRRALDTKSVTGYVTYGVTFM